LRESAGRLKLAGEEGADVGYGKLIGEGKVAEVFEYGDGRVLKLYRLGQPASDAVHEAETLAVVATGGVPAPRAHGVVEVDGRWGVVMDRIAGRPFAEPMLADMAGAGPYFAAMAKLQTALHAAPGGGLTPLKQRLGGKLGRAPGLADPVRQRLRDRLAALPDGDRILHGDFHPYNILGGLDGAVIVDWLDATAGPPAADVCRSWLLMQVASRDLAQAYLAAYLAASEATREQVFAWLPVNAAARLSENVPEEAAALIAMAEAG
jgi:aminoglycoside phosphotransferase (APT) family kinase protein